MGRRKLRFFVRKNQERRRHEAAKAQAEHNKTQQEFIVSIPRKFYSAAIASPCSSLDMLHCRLLLFPDFISSSWTSTLSATAITLMKSFESRTFLITVEPDFSLHVTVNDCAIENLSYFTSVKLDCVPTVLNTLEKCANSDIV